MAARAGAEPDFHFLQVTFLFAQPVRARAASAGFLRLDASMLDAAPRRFGAWRWKQ